MNRNVKGLIAVAVFGGIAFFVYRWIKKGGVTKLIEGDGAVVQSKAFAMEEGTPYYAYDKTTRTYQTTPKGFTKKGELLGNHYGNETDVTIPPNQKFKAITIWQQDESGIIIDKTKIKLK